MAKITVDFPVKDRMAEFVTLLKDRAMDPAYEPIRDTIADFVDKFLVVELKRLQNSTDVITEELEIPQEVLMEPIRQARNAIDEQFKKLLGGETLSDPGLPKERSPEEQKRLKKQRVEPSTGTSGNGHVARKVRDLTDSERDFIRSSFVNWNGQVEDDTCVNEIKPKLDDEVTIFQITGFVTYLHNQVAAGQLQLTNVSGYLDFIQKHRDLWAKYDSPKYRAMRAGRTSN